MTKTSWINDLHKNEIIKILEAYNLNTEGTLKEHRDTLREYAKNNPDINLELYTLFGNIKITRNETTFWEKIDH